MAAFTSKKSMPNFSRESPPLYRQSPFFLWENAWKAAPILAPGSMPILLLRCGQALNLEPIEQS
jgi:hypothetical protein